MHPFLVPESDQLRLFELGPDVARLRSLARGYSERTHADATGRAYASDWRIFEAWCAAAGRVSLPATEETVSLYLVHELQRRAMSTVDRRVAAIVDRHARAGQRSPAGGIVRDVLRGARRELGSEQRRKLALTAEDLRSMCRQLVQVRKRWAVRDRAQLLLGFGAGMRCSELVALDLADVHFKPKGLLVRIRRSKTDQEGRGRDVGIFAGSRARSCPVRALKAWLYVRGRAAGPLFFGREGKRMATRTVGVIVKRAAALAGLDPVGYGSHSLRAGFVTTAVQLRIPETLIMQRTGHRSVETVARYVRPASVFAVDALAGAL